MCNVKSAEMSLWLTHPGKSVESVEPSTKEKSATPMGSAVFIVYAGHLNPRTYVAVNAGIY